MGVYFVLLLIYMFVISLTWSSTFRCLRLIYVCVAVCVFVHVFPTGQNPHSRCPESTVSINVRKCLWMKVFIFYPWRGELSNHI